jgi:hypothetical protein
MMCQALNGVFCANFASSRGPWSPCCKAWYGCCYDAHPLDDFYRHVPTDDDGFDWRPVEDQNRFLYARNGDHLVTTFQCDLCWFCNLQQRNPVPTLPRDDLLLCCIRCDNLDAVWGREPLTVQATLRGTKHLLRLWEQVDLKPQFPALGPFPVEDNLGMRVAIAMLLKSREPGRYHAVYQQFETIRKLRATYSNIYMASYEGAASIRTVGGDRVKHHLTLSPTQSTWFERFALGCIRRMGQDVHQDWAIPLPAMHGLMAILEEEWHHSDDQRHKELVTSIAAFSIIAFCGSFRGPEVFLTDLHGLRKYLCEGEAITWLEEIFARG